MSSIEATRGNEEIVSRVRRKGARYSGLDPNCIFGPCADNILTTAGLSADNVPVPDTRECGCETLDPDIEACYCSLEPLVQAVGRRYALQVMNVIGTRERTRFVEIQTQLGGMSSSTLAARLHELESVQLIRRDTVGVDPQSIEYALTPRGRALRESLRRLFREANPFG